MWVIKELALVIQSKERFHEKKNQNFFSLSRNRMLSRNSMEYLALTPINIIIIRVIVIKLLIDVHDNDILSQTEMQCMNYA